MILPSQIDVTLRGESSNFSRLTPKKIMKANEKMVDFFPMKMYGFPNIVVLQWLEHIWNHKNMFETRGRSSLRLLIIAPGQAAY